MGLVLLTSSRERWEDLIVSIDNDMMMMMMMMVMLWGLRFMQLGAHEIGKC